MTAIVIGNSLSLVGAIALVISAFQKSQTKTVIFQTVNSIMGALASLVLGGSEAFITSIVVIMRNCFIISKKINTIISIIIIVVGTSLSLLFNHNGYMGFIPALAFLMYSIFFCMKDISIWTMKKVMLITSTMWILYNISILSYIGAIINIVYSISILSWLIKEKRNTNTAMIVEINEI